MVGTQVSHYDILEHLGGGGMGVVYKARDRRLGRLVALKFLPPEMSAREAARERFLREAKASSALDHPNICAVYEIAEAEDGQLFLSLAYCTGATLKRRLATGSVPVGEAVDLAVQIARGLGCAHRAGIVHRDIKPANIMVLDSGIAKIVDFGLASLVDEARITQTGGTVGTLGYMAPEQFSGDQVDGRADLWALGVVFYEMLTGRLPTSGQSSVATALSIRQSGPPPPPSALRPEVPGRLDAIVLTLLRDDPDERYQDAESLLEDLQPQATAVSGKSETALMTQMHSPWLKVRRRRRLLRASAAAAGIALAAVAAVFWAQRPAPPDALREVAVLPFANLTGDPANDHVSDGLAAAILARLGEVGGLRLVGRAEAWSPALRGLGAGQLGSRLGVGLLVDGTVHGGGELLRVNANLTGTATGEVYWSREFREPPSRQQALEQRVTQGVWDLLSIVLAEQRAGRLPRDPARAFRAADAYLRGREGLAAMQMREDPADAIAHFERATSESPEFPLAHAGLSEALWIRAQLRPEPKWLDDSERAAARALELDEGLPAGLVAMARVSRSRGRYDDSVDELLAAVERHPEPGQALRELALSYERLGDRVQAESCWRAAIAREQDNWRNHDGLGWFLGRQGDYEAAREALLEADRLAPEGVYQPRQNLLAVATHSGRTEEAIAVSETLPRPIRDARTASNIATAYFFSDRPDRWVQVERYYHLAARLSPSNFLYVQNLADFYQARGRAEEAAPLYRRALELVRDQVAREPENLDLDLFERVFEAKLGECEGALEELEPLAAAAAENLDSSRRVAHIYTLCGEIDPALGAVARMIELGGRGESLALEPELRGLVGHPEFERLTAGGT